MKARNDGVTKYKNLQYGKDTMNKMNKLVMNLGGIM